MSGETWVPAPQMQERVQIAVLCQTCAKGTSLLPNKIFTGNKNFFGSNTDHFAKKIRTCFKKYLIKRERSQGGKRKFCKFMDSIQRKSGRAQTIHVVCALRFPPADGSLVLYFLIEAAPATDGSVGLPQGNGGACMIVDRLGSPVLQ